MALNSPLVGILEGKVLSALPSLSVSRLIIKANL